VSNTCRREYAPRHAISELLESADEIFMLVVILNCEKLIKADANSGGSFIQ